MGLILVFDLDQTLAHTTEFIYFNKTILHLFEYITKKALRGTVIEGIFLLTNNASMAYVKKIDELLKTEFKSTGAFTGGAGYPADTYFFDYIMDYNHPNRQADKSKSALDVIFMANNLGIGYTDLSNLLQRTYFFDDLEHTLKTDMAAAGVPDHYIQIKPPFENKAPDNTNYEPVYVAVLAEEENLSKETTLRGTTFKTTGGKRSYKKRKTRRSRR